jgi:hypothetical protein
LDRAALALYSEIRGSLMSGSIFKLLPHSTFTPVCHVVLMKGSLTCRAANTPASHMFKVLRCAVLCCAAGQPTHWRRTCSRCCAVLCCAVLSGGSNARRCGSAARTSRGPGWLWSGGCASSPTLCAALCCGVQAPEGHELLMEYTAPAVLPWIAEFSEKALGKEAGWARRTLEQPLTTGATLPPTNAFLPLERDCKLSYPAGTGFG